MDTDVATQTVEAELRHALHARGLSFVDVDRALLTHWHSDHAGLAGVIQTESDATVYVHEADAPLVEPAGDDIEGPAPATAWEVSAALFGDLENIHVLPRPGEAYAHPAHLVHEGALVGTPDGYVPA